MALETEGENGAVDAEASVLLEDGEPVAAIVNLPGGDEDEGGDNSGGESEAIRIAEIHAEKEIAITAINAGVEEARIEAESERVISWQDHESELEALRANMQEQSREMEELRLRLSQAEASLLTPTPQPEPEPLPVLEVETVPETSLTPPSTMESETTMEPGPDDAGEKQVEIAAILAVPARRKRRLI